LFAPAFTATDDELGEMVSRFADVVTEVAKGLAPDLERSERVSSTPAGGVR
jgi:hypothetical protein